MHRQHRLDQRLLFGPERGRRRLRRQRVEPGEDFVSLPRANELARLRNGGAAFVPRHAEQCGAGVRMGGGRGEPVEQGMEPGGPPDMAAERVATRLARLQPGNGGSDDSEVAGLRRRSHIAERVADQREHFRLILRLVAADQLNPRLKVFGGARRSGRLPPPDQSVIEIARGVLAFLHMDARDRDGEVGAEEQLPLHRVVHQISAGANILAIEIEQKVGGLQRLRLHPLRPGGGEAFGDAAAQGLQPTEIVADPATVKIGARGGHATTRPSRSSFSLQRRGRRAEPRSARAAPSIPRWSRSQPPDGRRGQGPSAERSRSLFRSRPQ